jgi:hypothetical protein
MDEETRRILKEMKARRFRVVVIRPDGSRAIIGKKLAPGVALPMQIRLILENGLSNVLKELETPASCVNPPAPTPDDTPESN